MLAIAAVTILRRVIVGAREVDFRTILGAISVFTLLGLLFAFLYFAFSRWSHDPFFAGHVAARSSDYLFFSYTTLTTTGYGNLVPAGTVGQSFAVLEMLVGQIFLVTLVAGLVSLWRPGSSRSPGRRHRRLTEHAGAPATRWRDRRPICAASKPQRGRRRHTQRGDVGAWPYRDRPIRRLTRLHTQPKGPTDGRPPTRTRRLPG